MWTRIVSIWRAILVRFKKKPEWVDMNPMADAPRPTLRRYHRNHKTKGAFGRQPKGGR